MNEQEINKINDIMNSLSPELKKLTMDIYNNPELGREEYKACAWQVDLLEKYNFCVETNFCDIPTAYRAVYKGKKSGPKIAMLSEYDALPEMGHACGHNLIALVAIGAGITMREFADKYGGEIYVIGTPAEESSGAKVEMTRKDAFDDMDVAMMAHPAYINAESLNTIAIRCLKFEFYGKPAHASSIPENGLNALDAVINMFNMVNALRQQTKDDARIHGIITHGGAAPNIIPEYTQAIFNIRAKKDSYLDELTQKVKDCALGAALGTGTKVEISKFDEDFKDTNSNMTLSDLACNNAIIFGATDILRFNGVPISGSSDLGDVSYACPAIQLGFKIGTPPDGNYTSSHTKHFLECAGSDEAIYSGLRYAKAFALTGLELMSNPSHLKSIKEEFARISQNRY